MGSAFWGDKTDDANSCEEFELSVKKAKKIQQDYGVLCQSIDALDESFLTKGNIDMSPRKGEKEYGWNKVLKILKYYPSNAILINDRNLFSNESRDSSSGKPGNKAGIENLYEILEEIIPKLDFSNKSFLSSFGLSGK